MEARVVLHLATILCLTFLSPISTSARAEIDPRSRTWVAAVVSDIARADERLGTGKGGTVSIRIRIEADGTLASVGIDESSGSADIDERALRAAKAAAPFKPPPAKLLVLEGFTELSFPLQLKTVQPR